MATFSAHGPESSTLVTPATTPWPLSHLASLPSQRSRSRSAGPRLAAQHGLPWHRPTPPHSFAATPRRTFRWYRGQKHYSGTYWSSTEL